MRTNAISTAGKLVIPLFGSIFLLGALLEISGGAPGTPSMLVVTCKKTHSVAFIDTASNKQVAACVIGVEGHELAVSPDGAHVFVPIYGLYGFGSPKFGEPGTKGNTVDVVEVANKTRVRTIDLGEYSYPHGATFGPDGLLYVTAEGKKAVAILDPKTMKRVGSISTGQEVTHMIAITRDGRRAYTANIASGTVTVLDLEARKALRQITIGEQAQRIALSPDERWAFSNDVTGRRVAFIDTRSHEVSDTVSIPGKGLGMSVSPDGKWLLSVMYWDGGVAVVDIEQRKLVRTLPTGKNPSVALFTPDGSKVYVSNTGEASIYVFDTSSWEKIAEIATDPGPDGMGWVR